MKPAFLFVAIFFFTASFPQQHNRYCDFGRGCVTAINYSTSWLAGAGWSGVQRTNFRAGFSLWYRIIRRNKKTMCDHHWILAAQHDPFGANRSFALTISDLWWRNENWNYMIRVGPSLQRVWQQEQNFWLPGVEASLFGDPLLVGAGLHVMPGSKSRPIKQISFSISISCEIFKNSRYSCSR
ncbi:MAG: hypothetical protein MUC87_01540 [Bacteroidia bacterium]|jgi:hypothetical protein|nr:hypothetical protein [Bacteroidia bacterium]